VSKLAIIETIEVAPGSREQVLPFLMAHRAGCLKDEPGTLQLEVLVPNDDTTNILLYELYRDAAAFEAHWNGPSTARVRQEVGSMIAKI
jgi:(4S)-4-hydroxy-5-phosphonooxypentane-2,3-dione isomerase